MPHKYWYCGTFDFKKVSKTGLYMKYFQFAIPFIQKFYFFKSCATVHLFPSQDVFILFLHGGSQTDMREIALL